MTIWLNHQRIVHAAQVMRAGGVIAYPTESVWGLGCDPANHHAIRRLLQLKRRPRHKGLILIAAESDQVAPWLASVSAEQREQLRTTWPGPNTWLVPNRGLASHWVVGDHTSVALRVTNHPVAKALCMAFGGPIISTSANPQKRPAAKTSIHVRRYFGAQLDAIAPGQTGGNPNPSMIRDLASGSIVRG
ncbi:L-threonylcarbamoyladenylate synthase [Gilvimarinus sp. 1_MG-2023]|uniref:L-threonylcarbamoyladenylate synthase n=1 Tax=Gilvimarinus sp. 1_MG-2023 TaxID=3062638 RepID=UPI0026E3BDB8|nr:L-threonylcarbamoyladenylate synthase [Gilvimarinus sp. 1_MG-2023]MDO6747540.1 L-threonylcarbamoyladenylate synthase [Gilvimarinus sp. 1_MG-2023]